jgi:calcium/calmodulin-dependent protein kinase (CaM kinase) II
MTAEHTPEKELLDLTQRLLDAIASGDWEAYQVLCAGTLTAFEPEARGHLVEGLEFHRYYFSLPRSKLPTNTTIASPHVRLLGEDTAIVSYVRLLQDLDDAGRPQTSRFEETRVWQRQQGQWRHVHFHRSANS